MKSESESDPTLDADQESDQKPGFIYAVIGQGLFSVSRLMTSVVIGGRFGQGALGTGSEEHLGIYLAYFSIMLLSISVLEAFVTIPMTYLMHTRRGFERKQFSSFLLLVCGGMACVTGVAMLGVGCLLQFWYASISINVLIAFCFFVVTQYVREFLVRWILARLESKQYVVVEALYFITYVPILVGLLFIQQLTVTNLFIGLAFANLVTIALWWGYYKNEFVNVFSRDHQLEQSTADGAENAAIWNRFLPTIKEQIFYGRWIGADSVCYLATVYFCNWYLLLTTGAAGAGVYGACMTVVLLVNPFLNGVMSVLAPVSAVEFERGGKPALTKTMLKFGIPLTLMIAAFSCFLFFAGDWLTEKFFGDKYSAFFEENYNGVNRITFLIGLSMPFTTLAYVLAAGVMAYGKPRYTFLSSAVGLASMIVLCFLLKDPDLEQCAICFTISVVIMTAARFFFYVRQCRE